MPPAKHVYPMPDVLEPPAKRPPPPQLAQFAWTSERAREMQAKGVEARLLRRNPLALIAKITPDNYTAQRIARVRAQLDRIDGMLLEADGSQDIERLARAAGTLAEQLRVLLDKPLPGSRKPPAEPREPRCMPSTSGPRVPDDPPAAPPAQPTRPVGWEYDDPASYSSSSGTLPVV